MEPATVKPARSKNLDVSLILRAKAGDEDAWSELYRQCRQIIERHVRAAFRAGRDEDDARSRAGEAFMASVRAFDPAGVAEFATYLWVAVRHAVWKAEPRCTQSPPQVDDVDPSSASGFDAVDDADELEVLAPRLNAALASLDDDERNVVRMRIVEGLEWPAIAGTNDAGSISRVRRLYDAAIAKLRAAIGVSSFHGE